MILEGKSGEFTIYPPNHHEVIYVENGHNVKAVRILPPGTYSWTYNHRGLKISSQGAKP